jgi:hypothetical protein
LHCFRSGQVSQDSIEPDEPPTRGSGGGSRITYVFQTVALVVLEQPVLATVVAVAEAAVADDALGALLAVLVVAADLLGRHAAEEREGQVERRLALDVVVGQVPRGREVSAGVDEAEVGFGSRRPYGEEGREVLNGEVLGHGDGECCGRRFVSLLASYGGGGEEMRLTVSRDGLDEDLHCLGRRSQFWGGGSRHGEEMELLVVAGAKLDEVMAMAMLVSGNVV